MKKHFIQNEHLKIGINQIGAELANLQSVKNGTEYLWQADPEYWGRHSCILFPYIGKVWEDSFRIGDRKFNGKQHGFARNMEFVNVLLESEQAIFQLASSPETLKLYPYQFTLSIKYILANKSLRIIYEVENTDDQAIYFSLGAHPGFVIPLLENEKRSDYALEFEQDEWKESQLITDGFLNGKSRDVFHGRNRIQIEDDLFDHDALIFKYLNSNHLHLVNAENEKIWTFSFEGFPYLGIWSKNQKSPFVCIEPWMGVADKLNAEWDFREKEGVVKLEKGKTFKCEHMVTVY